MQPYFLPYIGYIQLIKSVDTFVLYDDVNYIERGWINRNFFLCNNNKKLLTLKLSKASCNKLIKDINILPMSEQSIFKTIYQSYSRAPYFKNIESLLDETISYDEQNLSLFIFNHLQLLCRFLNIKTNIILSSTIEKDQNLKGQEKVLNICSKLNATCCINPSGSKEMYEKTIFIKNSQQMFFIKPFLPVYRQFNIHFVNGLSFLDILMFNSKDQVLEFIDRYTLE